MWYECILLWLVLFYYRYGVAKSNKKALTTTIHKNTTHNNQHEPLPPYSQRLCPLSPWQPHPPWPQITAPWLPLSLCRCPIWQVCSCCSFPLVWGAEMALIKKREWDGALTLGGRHSMGEYNNQPNDSVGGGGGGCVLERRCNRRETCGEDIFLLFGAANQAMEN